MADNKSTNITQQDVTDWMRQAPVDSLIPVVSQALDKIASGPRDYHDRFTQQLSPSARRLFENQPVG